MSDDFRSWKRKLGVVTLLIACLFLAGWVKSFCSGEFWTFKHSQLRSLRGGVFWEQGTSANDSYFSLYCAKNAEFLCDPYVEPMFHDQWQGRCFGFGVSTGGRSVSLVAPSSALNCVRAPYWSIVIPLTLHSAYLLLSKSRPTSRPQQARTVPDSE